MLALKAVGSPSDDVWNHIKNHSLSSLILNTFWPVVGVGIGSFFLGTLSAFLIVFCSFPGKAVFEKLFILPLALPLYITAFVYRGLFEYSGPLPTWLRTNYGIHLDHYFQIQSLPAICAVFSFSLYPYVYLMARDAFLSTGIPVLKQAASLGVPLKTAVIKLLLPACLPWILGGTLLAMMETLSDFGGFAAFGHDTLTTAIYTSWFGLFSISTACKISLFLLIASIGLIFLWKKTTPRRHTDQTSPFPFPLSKKGQILSTLISFGIVFFSLCLPICQLFIWSWKQENIWNLRPFLINSLILSLGASLLIIPWGLFWSYLKRNNQKLKGLIDLSLSGYALPGILIATSVFASYKGIGIHSPWGTLVILFLAYTTRFLSVAFNPLHSACEQIPLSLDKTALSLGKSRYFIFVKVHLPLIKRSVGGAFLLIFMELFKEMPMTVFIRPFNLDTLAVKIFEFTSEGEWEMASPPSLLLVFFSMIVILIMTKETYEPRPGTHRRHPSI